MTNNTNNTTTNNTAITTNNVDPGWKSYLESLDSLCTETEDDLLKSSFQKAEKIRNSYRRWVASKLEDDPENDFLLEELERMQHADDSGINRWDTRPELGDIEYGVVDKEPRELETGFGHLDLLDAAEMGPELTWVNHKTFVKKADAQAFVDRTRAAFKKGDHSAEIIGCEIRKGQAEPFVAVVLEADGNWGHRKALAAARDQHLENAMNKVAKSTTRGQLNKVAQIAKRYSRDMQVLNAGKTRDGNRKVGIGFDYKRFATCMNAIAARAEELGFSGFRTYKINEFESTRKPTNGDLMDRGCMVGEFLGLEVAEDSSESLWTLEEKTWKPSRELDSCLVWHNPAFVFGPVAYESYKDVVRAA